MRLNPHYLPTPAQITEACILIRQQWSPAELKRRRMYEAQDEIQPRWQPPQINTSLCNIAIQNALLEV